MGKVIGNRLPDDLYEFLGGKDITSKANKVIMFTTVDERGYPHHGMLSPYEVVARDRGTVNIITYSTSKGSANLRRTGKVALMFVDEKMSYYVKGDAREGAPLKNGPTESFFEVRVEEVTEDKLPTAKITSCLTFEGYDPGMTLENRMMVFQELLSRR